jgi:CTP:molybdopterin cytidylyltransferase MocA
MEASEPHTETIPAIDAANGPPTGVVFLAAGRGTRLSELTETTHKALLPIGGKPVLQHAVDVVLDAGVRDIVVVTGSKAASLEEFLGTRYSDRVTVVYNDRFETDTNILSTEIGVSALRRPEEGYMIIEADLVIEREGWSQVLSVGPGSDSFWVTQSVYGVNKTGGAVRTDVAGNVLDIVYSSPYDPAYDGWQKLMGVLFVGPDQVTNDRRFRREAISHSIAQYYMMPWVENLRSLPCKAKDLGELFARTFNDAATYRQTADEVNEFEMHGLAW